MLGLCVFMAFGLALAVPAAASSLPSPSFSAALSAEMEKAQVPGVGIAVIRDYAVEWASGFGIADEAHGDKPGGSKIPSPSRRPQGQITPDIARARMVRREGETPEGKCFPAVESGEQACHSSWGLGFDVNLTKTFEYEADGRRTGDWFGHSGFNSGYLTLALGSKTGGRGLVVMANIAPEDMSGDVPQWGFMMWVARKVGEEEGW